VCLAKPGDRVTTGQPLLELRTDTPDAIPSALEALQDSFTIAEGALEARSLVIDTIRG
jgi:thymidine phosphorylase